MTDTESTPHIGPSPAGDSRKPDRARAMATNGDRADPRDRLYEWAKPKPPKLPGLHGRGSTDYDGRL